MEVFGTNIADLKQFAGIPRAFQIAMTSSILHGHFAGMLSACIANKRKMPKLTINNEEFAEFALAAARAMEARVGLRS